MLFNYQTSKCLPYNGPEEKRVKKDERKKMKVLL